MSATRTRPAADRVHVIRLPDGRVVTVAEYCRSWRALKAMAPRALVRGWDHFPTEAGAILQALREGLHDRINRRLAWSQDGRKWAPIWQRDMARAARDLNHPRLRIHWLPPELRERFGHRLATRED